MLEQIAVLLQDVGGVDSQIGSMLRATRWREDRVGTGTEPQALLESVSVDDSELVSEAERAWEYGDQAAQARAVRETT